MATIEQLTALGLATEAPVYSIHVLPDGGYGGYRGGNDATGNCWSGPEGIPAGREVALYGRGVTATFVKVHFGWSLAVEEIPRLLSLARTVVATVTCPACGQVNPEAVNVGAVDGPRAYHADCWRALTDEQQAAIWEALAEAGTQDDEA